jgi:hypothetical protein
MQHDFHKNFSSGTTFSNELCTSQAHRRQHDERCARSLGAPCADEMRAVRAPNSTARVSAAHA